MDDFHLYEPHSDSDKFYWYLYSSLNSTAGGILFGIGFMLGAKYFPEKSAIKDYMLISGDSYCSLAQAKAFYQLHHIHHSVLLLCRFLDYRLI
jgi:hypothetical protein